MYSLELRFDYISAYTDLHFSSKKSSIPGSLHYHPGRACPGCQKSAHPRQPDGEFRTLLTEDDAVAVVEWLVPVAPVRDDDRELVLLFTVDADVELIEVPSEIEAVVFVIVLIEVDTVVVIVTELTEDEVLLASFVEADAVLELEEEEGLEGVLVVRVGVDVADGVMVLVVALLVEDAVDKLLEDFDNNEETVGLMNDESGVDLVALLALVGDVDVVAEAPVVLRDKELV